MFSTSRFQWKCSRLFRIRADRREAERAAEIARQIVKAGGVLELVGRHRAERD